MRRAALALPPLLAIVLPAAGATAKNRVDVHPGRHAIQKAVDRARPGSVLRIHGGRYREAPVIDTRVKLVGVGRGRPVIDGRCDTRFTVEAGANGVKLAGLKVVGASAARGPVPSEVDFSFVRRGVANDLVLRDTCDAEYGVNVYDSPGAIKIRNSRALGFADAAYYIGGIADTAAGPIRVRASEAYGNNRGVIVEDSSAAADIRIEQNDLHDNDLARPAPIAADWPPTGVLINNSDGVLIEGNEVTRNGIYGLRLTESSDRNAVDGNELLGNPVDILDLGSGNCGSDNVFRTGDALPPCGLSRREGTGPPAE